MWLYASMFVIAVVQCCALTHGAMHVGRLFRILDFPDKQRKRHCRATPRTGGTALCAALILGVVEACCLSSPRFVADVHAGRFTLFLLVSAALLCGLGLWDDKFGMRARSKFFWQTAAIIPFVCWGRSTASAYIFGW